MKDLNFYFDSVNIVFSVFFSSLFFSFSSRDLDLERINFLFSSACTLFSFLRRGGRFRRKRPRGRQRKEGKSKWMSGSKWKLEGEGSSGRHLTGKRHSHRIQPRSFLSLPWLASPLSPAFFLLRHLLRWRVACSSLLAWRSTNRRNPRTSWPHHVWMNWDSKQFLFECPSYILSTRFFSKSY